MFLKAASHCISAPFFCLKHGALAILLLPAVATAFSGTAATGNYANDLGYIMGIIDYVKHRATVCTEESPSVNEPLAIALVNWNERNLFVLGEVNDRYRAVSNLYPSFAATLEQRRREKLDQMRARYSLMSPAKVKATCDTVADDLNIDFSDLENVLKSRLESVRGHTRSGER